MTTMMDRYLKTLNVASGDATVSDAPSSNDDKKVSKRADQLRRLLDRSYKLRDFEIELYWKRATYFWGFQAAIFTAYAVFLKKPEEADTFVMPIVSSLLAMIGVATAFANYFSALGSKFWQENWESHIDMLEDEIDGRLYKTVWLPKNGIGYSVSNINLSLLYIFIIYWITVFEITVIYYGMKYTQPATCEPNHAIPEFNTGFCVSLLIPNLILVAVVKSLRKRSNFEGTIPTSEGDHGEERIPSGKLKKKIFTRRYSPVEPEREE